MEARACASLATIFGERLARRDDRWRVTVIMHRLVLKQKSRHTCSSRLSRPRHKQYVAPVRKLLEIRDSRVFPTNYVS